MCVCVLPVYCLFLCAHSCKDWSSDSFTEMNLTRRPFFFSFFFHISYSNRCVCFLIDPYTGVCSSKLSQHIGRKRTGVCRVMVSFQIWMSVSFIMFVIRIFLGVTEWCRTSSGKSGTSVRYQSFGCSASGHLENICTNRRSQMFLWIR